MICSWLARSGRRSCHFRSGLVRLHGLRVQQECTCCRVYTSRNCISFLSLRTSSPAFSLFVALVLLIVPCVVPATFWIRQVFDAPVIACLLLAILRNRMLTSCNHVCRKHSATQNTPSYFEQGEGRNSTTADTWCNKRWVSSHSRFCTFFVGNAMSNKFSFSLVHPSRCSFSSPSSSNRETMFCHSTFRTRKTEMRVISFLRGLRLVESHLYRFRATKLVTVVFYWRTILGYL